MKVKTEGEPKSLKQQIIESVFSVLAVIAAIMIFFTVTGNVDSKQWYMTLDKQEASEFFFNPVSGKINVNYYTIGGDNVTTKYKVYIKEDVWFSDYKEVKEIECITGVDGVINDVLEVNGFFGVYLKVERVDESLSNANLVMSLNVSQ